MHRSHRLLVSMALIAGLALSASPVAAATTVSYTLTGTAATSLFPQVSMSGTAKSKTARESGTWSAVFSQDLGSILGGTFTIKSKVRSASIAITGGTFGPSSGTCAKTTIPVHGLLAGGGTFDATITRTGSLVNGSCSVSSSTVAGSASVVYP